MFASLFVISASAKQAPEAPERKNWDKEPIYGNVDSLIVTTYYLPENGEKLVQDEVLVVKFDENGNVIERPEWSQNEAGVAIRKYKYNEKGETVEMLGCMADGSVARKYVYAHDANGKVVEETFYIAPDFTNYDNKLTRVFDENGVQKGGSYDCCREDLSYRYDFKYDSKGNRVEELYYYKSNDSLYSHNLVKYNEKGHIIEIKECDGNGKLTGRRTSKVDENGNILEQINYNSDGTEHDRVVMSYNSQGDMTEYSMYRPYSNILIFNQQIKRNEKGQIIEVYSAQVGYYPEKTVFKYDSNNNVAEIKTYYCLEKKDLLVSLHKYKFVYRK